MLTFCHSATDWDIVISLVLSNISSWFPNNSLLKNSFRYATFELRRVISNNVVVLHEYTQTRLYGLRLSLETPNDVQSVAKSHWIFKRLAKSLVRLRWGFPGRTNHIVGNLMAFWPFWKNKGTLVFHFSFYLKRIKYMESKSICDAPRATPVGYGKSCCQNLLPFLLKRKT